jgi:imidazolonepropionase-like amidohydrolase
VTGCIAPGYAADLIAVQGDPAEGLQALDDLRLVLANGRTIRRDGDAG